MKGQPQYITLIISLMFAINTALMTFDVYHLNNEQLDAVGEVISLIGVFAGILLNHFKDKPPEK